MSLILLYGPMLASASSGAGETSNEDVEILIEGKRYRSPHDYKREKLKDTLLRSLTPNVRHDFSDDEIVDIITEVLKSQHDGEHIPEPSNTAIQPVDGPSEVTPSDVKNDPAVDNSEMQKMLKQYQHEHAEADAVIIDPDKVKNIFIKSQK